MSIDWKSHLQVHYPNIARIYLDAPSTMKKNDRRMQEELQKRHDGLLHGKKDHKTTFYDLFVRTIEPIVEPRIGSEREGKAAIGLLKFINEQIGEFVCMVNGSKELIYQLKQESRKLFFINGNEYLNAIGELASAVYLLNALENYKLKELTYVYEKVKPKGEKDKNVDLLFVEKTTGDLLLVDIVNMHLEYERIEDEAGLYEVILNRLSQKRAAKETSSHPSDKNMSPTFHLDI